MIIGELFAGIGGLGIAAAWVTGGRVAWQVEFDPAAAEVLRQRGDAVVIQQDVRTLTRDALLDSVAKTSTDGVWLDCREEHMGRGGWFRKLSQEQVDEAVRMYERGLSLAPIAAFYSVSRQAMWDLLRRRTQMRPQKRYGSNNHFYRGGETQDDEAQNIVEYALRIGVLTRPEDCSECKGTPEPFADGRSAIQAHHIDYNKPLEVMWLCQPCHHEWHKNHRAKPKEVAAEAPAVDMIVGGFP